MIAVSIRKGLYKITTTIKHLINIITTYTSSLCYYFIASTKLSGNHPLSPCSTPLYHPSSSFSIKYIISPFSNDSSSSITLVKSNKATTREIQIQNYPHKFSAIYVYMCYLANSRENMFIINQVRNRYTYNQVQLNRATYCMQHSVCGQLLN